MPDKIERISKTYSTKTLNIDGVEFILVPLQSVLDLTDKLNEVIDKVNQK